MQLFRVFSVVYILLGSAGSYAQKSYNQYDFAPPLDIPLFLSANFGELRGTHFHSGLDFKTQQQIGKNVYASDEGYISRIKVQSGSYGKSLYITHPNGFTTVYAHLNEYMPEVEKYINSYQYAVKKFEVDVYPGKNEFPVSKRQFIAKSGNTGYSGGPHLHFEIRDQNQHPLNALKFNFNITDNIRPEIVNLAIYPVDEFRSLINGKPGKMILRPVKTKDGYTLKDTVLISGNTGFGIETYDYLNGSGNKCTVYSIELSVNGLVYYYHLMDKFSFDESKYISSHVDYEEYILQKIKLHKLFPDPNNKLSIYRIIKDGGVVNFQPDSVYNIKIEVKDTYLNTSVLSFMVKGGPAVCLEPKYVIDSSFVRTLYYHQFNGYIGDGCRISMQPNTLFKNINFTCSALEVDTLLYSPLHFVHSDLVPVGRSYTLAIKAENLARQYYTKALIACLDRENKQVAEGGAWNNGFIEASVRKFGRFFIALDTIPPDIKPLDFKNNGIFQAGDIIKFKITDDFSGIKSYNGYIDNEWALFEYDAKEDMLSYRLDNSRIKGEGLHSIEVVVVDERNNIAVYRSTFYN
ncbi:MAG: M23 family metallopeptidase [Bacteroidales bacterium]|nr:M23 family metallopeptidase [Bacteroidales bacterium]